MVNNRALHPLETTEEQTHLTPFQVLFFMVQTSVVLFAVTTKRSPSARDSNGETSAPETGNQA
ncbi:hypothetical protein EVAR_42936_1 [Eumeta japonica]|uniref:Uncharacterized protein n=1 Tax=Eumeta variegata TaxID=151549 RepID=A0A4C1YFK2_EUMVA|nr:hypothetical protein EVAR_42936_1 [Eumeta japonica]